MLGEVALERGLVGDAIAHGQRAASSGRRGIAHVEDLGRNEARQRENFADVRRESCAVRIVDVRAHVEVDLVDDHASARLASSAPTMPNVMITV